MFWNGLKNLFKNGPAIKNWLLVNTAAVSYKIGKGELFTNITNGP